MPSVLSFVRRGAAFSLVLVAATGCLDTTNPLGNPSNPATEVYATSLGVNISAFRGGCLRTE